MTLTAAARVIRRASPDDASRVAGLAARTFRATYATDTDPVDLEAYLSATYRLQAVRDELASPHQRWLIATVDGQDAGFASLVEGESHPAILARRPVLLGHLYLERKFQGIGLGADLMNRAMDEARLGGHDVIWLGVWERNVRAIDFYRRLGLFSVGETTFTLGRERQRDLVMARSVRPGTIGAA